MSSDQLRLLWTAVGFGGTVIGAVAFLVMTWLARETEKDDWAIAQVRPPRMDFMRMHTRGDIEDQHMKMAIVAVLLLGVTAEGLAGLGAMLGLAAVLILGLLVASEVAQVVALGLLLKLGLMKHQRRRSIFSTLRLNRRAK